ncbi:DUF4932 domain-containing protein [Mucilaginibacter endophyticus]|uniref:DUF4932 domain-containing protein n=1 Tax=Mucilaginibacter endophyticus TaxID=2675003 RepID=UPI000E0D5EF4|nr:DUF4932 domain-containing protein [Mucilaginibacter endophyticus]
MKKILLLVFIVLSGRAYSQVKDQLKVNVHPGVELFTIVQILADKYPQPNPSAYSKEVLAYFEKYKDHPAVKKVATFEKTYTDLVELGWCMSNFPNIKIYEPAELSWYKNYGKENVLEYIKLCRDFFNDTHFWDFYQRHAARYTQWGNALKASVDSAGLVQKLQGFYKYNADVHWWICIDPLNSWGSHAITTKTINPQFADWIVYNTGYFARNADPQKDPYFEFTNFDNLVFHEGSHIYLNGLEKQYQKQIEELAYLFNKDDDGMRRNSISNWRYCFDENLVRSVTAALYHKYREPRAYKKQMAKELLSDFIYVEELAPFIYERYLESDKYKSFAEFFPEILTYLKQKHSSTDKNVLKE